MLARSADRIAGRLPARRLARCVPPALAASLVVALFTGSAMAAPVPDTFADLAEELLPSVVNISTTQVSRTSSEQEIPQAPPGSPFEDFFREFFERNRPENMPRRATSLGSGFIIDKGGIVVTNNHVIAEADEISVILQDNSRYDAEVLGRDPKTDLAVLKIDTGFDLPAVSFGDSTTARVGDWVLAIGNPFGLGGSVTAGIISAQQRDINTGPYDSFIQTDASINRGNSGGPLFNIDGQVIGVNTAIFSPSGGSVGIGFSVPSEIAQRVVRQLQDYGRTRRGWLGVRIQTVTEEIAESLGLEGARGALVASVSEGGPAEDAGIVAGDVVLSFDGRPIEEMRDLPRIVADTDIGKAVRVELWRKDAMEVVSVKIGELEESPVVASLGAPDAPGEGDSGEIRQLGLGVAAITDTLREEFGIAEGAKGVLVTEVSGDGPAADKGIRPGDIIVEVSQEEIASPSQIKAKVAEAQEQGRRSILLLVEREGDLRFVAVRI